MRVKYFTGILSLLLIVSVVLFQNTFPATAQEEGQVEAVYTVGEGVDYATRVLSDPWDMAEFTDISQWLNNASTYLLNIQVANGIFSATTAASYSEFYALFPGYILGMNTGKIGAMHPIASGQFACYSMAMYSSWASGTNYFRVDWEYDRYNLFSGDTNVEVWGMSYPHYMTPNTWKLYQTNLNSPPILLNDAWYSQSAWQGLRIVPSIIANTQFSIDWIRLTDCTPVWVTFSGLSTAEYNLWIAHGSPERQILAAERFIPVNGSYTWDAQGVEPGTYTYYIKTTTGSLVQQGTLNVDSTPIASFNRPAQFTGTDYSTANGNAWDMEPSDVSYIACVNYSFTNGMLYLDTLPPTMLPDGCVGDGASESDPHVFLNTPDHGNLSIYRYLSFNMYQNGSISYPDKGMIVRMFWQLDRIGLTDCWYTSRAIPLEVGRHTYTVDLFDPRNGTPEARTPSDCPLVTWANQASVGPLVQFRIDPNENVLNWTFHQEIDWIRLTRVETVRQGRPAEIRLLLNGPVAELSALDLYYTTDRAQPAQHPVARYTPPTISGQFLSFLPMTLRLPAPFQGDPFIDALSADGTYWWDTSGVSPGTYYICALAADAHTSAFYCSQAPFQIITP